MIQVKHLTKQFGQFRTVDDISFTVYPGEISAFLGPNGAGKTTTIKMLTSGTVEVDGLDPAASPNQVRKRFGIMFQDPS